MIIRVVFDYNGKHFEYNRPFVELDRNYSDENYAYMLERIPNTDYGLFELNILKENSNSELQETGYVAVYLNEDTASADYLIEANVSFWYC